VRFAVSHISQKTSEMWGTQGSSDRENREDRAAGVHCCDLRRLWVLGREEIQMTEPLLRGTLTDLPVVQRALLHSLEMAQEDIAKWCGGLDDREVHARPFQLPAVAFQLRHIARSLDRFCCYAEGVPLSPEQLQALASEMEESGGREAIFGELEAQLERTRRRLDAIVRQPLDLPVRIGRKGLPTTLTGLLIHAAEHTQRHVGQAITTAKVILAQRGPQCGPSSPA
jgi:uncharacterized damage-inducible protein DinB